MADGSINLELDPKTAALLSEAAKAAGETPADFAVHLIAKALASGESDNSWRIANERLAQFDRTGEAYSLEKVLAEFRRTGETVSVEEGFSELERRLADRLGRG